VEAASRAPEFARTTLIVLRRGGHSQRAVAACERRRRAGLAAGLIDVGSTSTYVSLLALDRLMPLASTSTLPVPVEDDKPVVGAHPILGVMQQAGRQDEQQRGNTH